jgi:hypothetical protein
MQMRTGVKGALLGSALAVGLVLLVSSPAAAAPPANDDFDDAVAFSAVPFDASADTTEATRADDDPECVGGDGFSVWYSVTLAANTEIVVDTFGSDYDTTLSAWTGTRGSLEPVACNDDFGSLQSRIAFTAQAGVTYYLMAAAFPSAVGGNLVLLGGILPPRLSLAATLNTTGTVTSSGAAVISGTVTCSRPTDLTVTGTLREQNGRSVTVGSYRTAVSCSGTTPWRATVLGETGLYRRGTASGVAVGVAIDKVRGVVIRARATATIQLG